jgi:hypothetical protein
MPRPPEPPLVPDDATGGIPPEWLAGDDVAGDGPLGLAAVDAAIAANRAPESDPAPLPPVPPPCDRWQKPARQMQLTGYTPVPPDELTEESTGPGLWEFLHQLAIRNFFVTHTDHLTDNELYRDLWGKAIRDDCLTPGARSRTAYWMHDVLGSYGTEECNLQLAIYATDAERTRHTEQFPAWPLPEKRERLTLRDWRLPRPPF